MKKFAPAILPVLILLQSLAALMVLLARPSEPGSAVLLGYSAPRLALALPPLLALLASLALVLPASSLPARVQRCRQAAAHRLIAILDHPAQGLALTWLIGLAFILLTLPGVYFFLPLADEVDVFLQSFSPVWASMHNTLRAVHAAGLPVLVWAAVLCLEALVLVGIRRRTHLAYALRSGALLSRLLLAVLALASLMHAAILYFRLKTFLVVPGWKWYFYEKPLTSPGWMILMLMLMLGIAAAWLALRYNPNRRGFHWPAVLLFVGVGAALQIGFGFVEGGGFESLRVKYADGVFAGYARAAAKQPELLDAARNYEERYGGDWYLGTKPPGVLAVYTVVDWAANLSASPTSPDERFIRSTHFMARVFPFIGFLTLLPLMSLARRMLPTSTPSVLPLLWWVALPAVLLIPMFLDFALYPFIALIILLMVQRNLDGRSFGVWVLIGALLFVALYLSFSLLPVIALAFGWAALAPVAEWLSARRKPSMKELFREIGLPLLGMALGFAAALITARLLLNYDLLVRYTTAMQNHRRAKEYVPGLQQTLESMWLNTVEMVTWNGFPFAVFSLIGLGAGGWAWLRGKPTRLDALALAFTAAYAALNLLGQTDGEVQRLWLFLTPLLALFAAVGVQAVISRAALISPADSAVSPSRPGEFYAALVIGVLVAQWLVAFFIWHYQDFYG